MFGYDLFYPVLHQSVTSEQNPKSEGLVKLDSPGVNPKLQADVNTIEVPAIKSVSQLPRGLQGVKSGKATGALRRRPAGSMVVFGGESLQECYLNDVWVLHLNSLMWTELSKPVARQKRCRGMLEQN